MKSQSPYSNSLFISNYGKAIPYNSSKIEQKNGKTNYGFKNLKLKPQLIDTVPELSSDGYLYRGYIEFSFNCRVCVQDARNYFSLYFHFEQFLRQHKFDQKVKLQWMLEEVYFSDVDIDGFSCAIFIFTNHCSSCEEAYCSWQKSLGILESFLLTVQVRSHTLIYENC